MTNHPPRTLAELLAALEADASLAASRRRDLRSVLQRMAYMIGKPLERLPPISRFCARW